MAYTITASWICGDSLRGNNAGAETHYLVFVCFSKVADKLQAEYTACWAQKQSIVFTWLLTYSITMENLIFPEGKGVCTEFNPTDITRMVLRCYRMNRFSRYISTSGAHVVDKKRKILSYFLGKVVAKKQLNIEYSPVKNMATGRGVPYALKGGHALSRYL